jgi:hypothetical protein
MVDYAAVATEFRAGRVITRSFSTFFRNILPFGLLALVVTSPTYVYMLLTESESMGGPVDPMDFSTSSFVEPLVMYFVNMLLGVLLTAALVYGTIKDLRNDRASVGECFSKGLSLMLPVLGVAIVSTLLTWLAFLALILPGVYVAILLWVTIPVAVMERRGLGSLSRSAELTKGYRWRMLFLFLLLIVVAIGISLLIGAVAASVTLGAMNSSGEFSPASMAGLVAMQWFFSAFLSALMAVIAAVSYHDLRVAKEGADTSQIAAVFD